MDNLQPDVDNAPFFCIRFTYHPGCRLARRPGWLGLAARAGTGLAAAGTARGLAGRLHDGFYLRFFSRLWCTRPAHFVHVAGRCPGGQ